MSEAREDREIITSVLGGDVNAFKELVERYQNYVAGVVVKHVPYAEVEEICHEVFIRAFRSLSSFRGESEFRYWLAKIAVRRSYDYWRECRKRKEISMSALDLEHQGWVAKVLAAEGQAAFDDANYRAQAQEVLRHVLSQLSAEDRMIISLIYFEGNSIEDTAAALGLSKTNVKVKAHRLRKKLRDLIEHLLEEASDVNEARQYQ